MFNIQREKKQTKGKGKVVLKKNVWLLVLGIIGGVLGFLTQFPIGTLLGTLLVIATVNIKFNYFPPLALKTKRKIQILIGASIGLTFSKETFAILTTLIVPSLMIAIITIIISLNLAVMLHKLLKFDLTSALCSLAPAGMSEMVLIAEKYDAYIPAVVTIHLFRIITIITVIPIIVYLLS